MLTNLKIENVAVIEKANISFENGLNILTGETGAGKSIVIDSINAVLGERTSKEIVRTGEATARVTAYFEDIPKSAVEVLSELDVDDEGDGTLLVSRVVSLDGRSSCKINGQPVTATMLRRLSGELITICGQHDSQTLLQSESHLGYIDSIAECGGLLNQYRELYREMRKLKKELNALSVSEADKQSRLDFLSYRINELESANIVPGEREKLKAIKAKIQNREKIVGSLYACKSLLSGDENSSGLTDGLHTLSSFLSQLSAYNGDYDSYISSIDSFRYELEDCLSQISDELDSFEDEPVDINEIEERLDVLYRLSRKYGETEEDMLTSLDEARAEYDSIAFSDEKKAKLEILISEKEREVFNLGCLISDCRKAAALRFEKQVSSELSFLNMPHAVFSVSFKDTEPQENGLDEVEFLFSANAGQEPRPLAKIASGGELSRVMLAIRCVLSDKDKNDTMIFDEIDSGVSGRAAQKIAAKLRQVSSGRQVICVTHLAQIAAAADNHLLIEKETDGVRTVTKVKKLENGEREREIARIIGGDIITEATLLSARELINFSSGSLNET